MAHKGHVQQEYRKLAPVPQGKICTHHKTIREYHFSSFFCLRSPESAKGRWWNSHKLVYECLLS